MKSRFKLEHFDSQVIPLSPDDLLELTTVAVTFPIVIEIEGTALDLAGALVPFRFVQNISASVTPTTNQFRLGYSGLLSVVVHTHTAAIPDGDCYCHLTLVKSASRGVFPHRKLLAQGYIATLSSIGYGSSSNNGPPIDHSFIQNIAIANPAAGADFAFVCPAFTYLEVISLTLDFISDATVVNRTVVLTITMPPGNIHSYPAEVLQVASLTRKYTFTPTPNVVSPGSSFFVTGQLPNLGLQNSMTLSSAVQSIQPADQLDNISILVKRHTTPFS
jgi:hypothetical protein